MTEVQTVTEIPAGRIALVRIRESYGMGWRDDDDLGNREFFAVPGEGTALVFASHDDPRSVGMWEFSDRGTVDQQRLPDGLDIETHRGWFVDYRNVDSIELLPEESAESPRVVSHGRDLRKGDVFVIGSYVPGRDNNGPYVAEEDATESGTVVIAWDRGRGYRWAGGSLGVTLVPEDDWPETFRNLRREIVGEDDTPVSRVGQTVPFSDVRDGEAFTWGAQLTDFKRVGDAWFCRDHGSTDDWQDAYRGPSPGCPVEIVEDAAPQSEEESTPEPERLTFGDLQVGDVWGNPGHAALSDPLWVKLNERQYVALGQVDALVHSISFGYAVERVDRAAIREALNAHNDSERLREELRVAREELERARTRHSEREQAIYDRLLEEAESRSWCSEFDDIMEELGFERRARNYTVTMEYTFPVPYGGDWMEVLDEEFESASNFVYHHGQVDHE